MARTSLASVVAVAILSACGNSPTWSPFDQDAGDGAPGDVATALALRVDPPAASATFTLGAAAPTVSFRALRKELDGTETDVTVSAVWSCDSPPIASIAAGTATLAGLGGKTKVRATLAGAASSADLTVLLTGDVFTAGTGPLSKQTFAMATVDANPANAPVLEYAEDGAVLPGNLPPIEFQWTKAADNALYRAHYVSADVLDVYVYTTARELTPPAKEWAAIASSVPDLVTTWTVDGVGASNQKRTSVARTFGVAADTIDESAIYVWRSSTGSFRVIDVAQGKDFAFPTTAPELGGGQPCSGCHRISRDGKRFAYTYNGGNFEFGSLAFDAQNKTFVPKIVPKLAYRATYATFNPNEASQIPAMIVAEPDTVAQNTAGTVRLAVRDPDTGAGVKSNLAASIAQLGAVQPGRATSMPDWSPDGTFVVFAAYDSDKNFVRLLGDDIVLSSIVEAPVTYDAQNGFTFGAPKVLVPADSNANPDTGANNVLPSIAPDGSAVAFTRAAGWWPIKTQQSLVNLSGQIMLVRRGDSQVFELKKGSNGANTTLSSSWPQWAPTFGKRYAWLAFASERPYGHEKTAQNSNCGALVQGQGSCKQLWVTAIDLQKLRTGTTDPSFAPFWIPGQSINAQYVSPQWTQAVITPPK